MAKVELISRISALKAETRQEMASAIDKSADEFLSIVQPIIPVSDLDATPGALRDSVHKEDGAHALAKIVVADAKDSKGREYGAHAELGHRTPGGGHVEGFHVWYPTFRLLRKRLLGRIKRGQTAAAKKVALG